ncbi:hypothetical protein HNO89_002742 [Sporosarcina luteola]|nr:hypothetical protein [Sporosarcina luteola]
MLKINKVLISIITPTKRFQPLYEFKDGLNIIYSRQNSIGKSSILSSIFYALGMEQLFNTKKNAQSLPFVFNEKIEDSNGGSHSVKESEIFLEISNGKKSITINRTIVSALVDSSLLSIYEGTLDDIENLEPNYYYVHYSNSTIRDKGFHKYLEDFLNIKLPQVLNKDNNPAKLYLQFLFATSFVSQKGGWNDYLGNVPYLGIKEPKKRIVEFLFGIKNDFLKQRQNKLKKDIIKVEEEWFSKYNDIIEEKLKKFNFKIHNLDTDIKKFEPYSGIDIVFLEESKTYTLLDKIESLKTQIQELEYTSLKIKESKYGELEKKYYQLVDKENILTKQLIDIRSKTHLLSENLKEDKISLQIIESDISNNNDIKIIKNLHFGDLDIPIVSDNLCPTCNQKVQDSISLNYIDSDNNIMSVEENIKHLNAQKKLLEFTIKGTQFELKERSTQTHSYEKELRKLRDFIRYLKKDLFLIENQISFSTTKQIVLLDADRETLEALLLSLPDIKNQFINIYNRWKPLHDELINLESETTTDIESIDDKVKVFSKNFNNLFQSFGQQSLDRNNYISISKDNLLPILNGFDLKSNLSASDMVRSIWAYIISLLQTSKLYSINHLDLIVMDEPAQHSIIEKDFRSLLETLGKIKNDTRPNQSIVALTTEDDDFIAFLKHPDLNANVTELPNKSIYESISDTK